MSKKGVTEERITKKKSEKAMNEEKKNSLKKHWMKIWSMAYNFIYICSNLQFVY